MLPLPIMRRIKGVAWLMLSATPPALIQIKRLSVVAAGERETTLETDSTKSVGDRSLAQGRIDARRRPRHEIATS